VTSPLILVPFLWRHHLYWYRFCDVPSYTVTVSNRSRISIRYQKTNSWSVIVFNKYYPVNAIWRLKIEPVEDKYVHAYIHIYSFGHYIARLAMYDFLLRFWYLQTLLFVLEFFFHRYFMICKFNSIISIFRIQRTICIVVFHSPLSRAALFISFLFNSDLSQLYCYCVPVVPVQRESNLL
jgi:hypothetical protein